MKTSNEYFAVRVLTYAVQGALAAMFATPLMAHAEEDVAALTRPESFVQVGVENVSSSSAKFGEYNGLNKSGVKAIGNFGVVGGNTQDGVGTLRYEFNGSDLGTTSREVSGSIGEQGRWNVKFGYDELKHNISDTYQTPYLQSMGGNVFTLPTSFGYIDTTKTTTTALPNGQAPGVGSLAGAATTWAAGTRNMSATQTGAFHTEDISSTRKNSSLGLGFIFDKQWNVQLDFNRLDQSGAKLQSVPTQSYSTTLVPVTTNGTTTWKNQGSIMGMSPTDYQTDTVNLALNWLGEKGNLTATYYGSFFRDSYNGYRVDSPMAGASATATLSATASCLAGGACYASNTMSTAPSNSLNQINVNGAYTLSNTLKMVGGFSFGRNTQHDSFLADPLGLAPNTSLNGVVSTKHANFKLTDTTFKDLTVTASLKFNERDNRTTSSLYKFFNIGNNPTAVALAAGTGATSVVNTPYSNKKTQLELAADYRLTKDQALRASVEHETVDRWCNNVAANPTVSGALAGVNCVVAPSSKEDRFNFGYRSKLSNDVNLGAGYTYGNRTSDYNPYFYTPYAIAGNEYTGYRPFFEASRIQNLLKANVNWQAAEQLSLSANVRFSKDKYIDSALGDKNGSTASINLDATYGYSENGSVSAYASWQRMNRNTLLTNNGSKTPIGVQAAETALWINNQGGDDQTVGINFKQGGLLAGKLDIAGDLTYSRDITTQSVFDYGLNTTKNSTNYCYLSNIATCGDYPDVVYKTVQFKLNGDYRLDKRSKLGVTYVFQKLASNDYYFNGYQTGYTASAQLPTNEQAPSYKVHAVGVSYTYSF